MSNTPKYVRETNSDPWAILIALASLIIVATGTAIFVICILWRKYQKNRTLFERNFVGVSYELTTAHPLPPLPPPPPPQPIMHIPIYALSPPPPAHALTMQSESSSGRDPNEYEVQTLDMFVPLEDRDDLGEVHVGFNPLAGIQSIHHVKEVKSKSMLEREAAATTNNSIHS